MYEFSNPCEGTLTLKSHETSAVRIGETTYSKEQRAQDFYY